MDTGSGGSSNPAAGPYESRPWLASYPPEIPAEISPFAHASLGEMLAEYCVKYGDRPSFTSMGKSIGFRELERASRNLAAWLQAQGLQRGARVAILMPNVLQYPIAVLAILRAGYVVVNVNPLYTPRELEYQLKDAGAEAIFLLENFAANLEKIIASTSVRLAIVASIGEMLGAKGLLVNFVVRRVRRMVPRWSLPGHVRFRSALEAGGGLELRRSELTPDDIAFLQYTGGTTGVAKGASLSHGNIMANAAQMGLWLAGAYGSRPAPERPVYLCALPLYHIFALTVNGVMGIVEGANNVLIINPRDISALVGEMRKMPCNVFPGINTLFNVLLHNEEFRKLDFSELALTLGGGMAVQETVARSWKEVTGCPITEGYGLSETSPVATANLCNSDYTGTIGLPVPSTEVAIRDDEGGDVPLGEVGEICIRGPQVMRGGYWNRPDETARVMTPDGFLRTGDMGFMNEKGFIKLVDRKKDMILVSGFNVYPNEIEEVVAEHPGVLEAAAIGVADEHSGEVPKLFVVRKDPNLTEAELIEFCRTRLTGYKRPKHIEFRRSLPKSNVGKILRRELKGGNGPADRPASPAEPAARRPSR